MPGSMAASFKRVAAIAAKAKLPGLAESVSYGTPSLKVAGKFLARMKDADTLVLRCPLEEKELLMESAPEIYFETDHYKGWPAILVRLAKIDAGELRHRLALAWRMQAPRRLVAEFEKTNEPGKRARK